METQVNLVKNGTSKGTISAESLNRTAQRLEILQNVETQFTKQVNVRSRDGKSSLAVPATAKAALLQLVKEEFANPTDLSSLPTVRKQKAVLRSYEDKIRLVGEKLDKLFEKTYRYMPQST